MTKLFDPFCQIRKNIVHMKLQPRMKALVTLGWRLKFFFFYSTRDSRSVSVKLCSSWTRAFVFRRSNSSMGNARPLQSDPDGIVKHSVIHRLRLIDSAQFCTKKFQSIR